MRRWRVLSAYATSGIPCRMWHIITTQYPPLLFERVAVSTAVLAYYLLPAACRISAPALRWCTATRVLLPRDITVQLASIRRTIAFNVACHCGLETRSPNTFSSRSNIIGAAVDAPGDAPSSAAMAPLRSLTTSVPRTQYATFLGITL